MTSSWGTAFRISIFGESHGPGIGVVVDGAPAGIPINRNALLDFMKRRAPGRSKASTPRKEGDLPEILSGILDGRTTGAPIAAVIRNNDTHSADYSEFSAVARPGHADYTAFLRYNGYNDIRGGGHFSGRLTAPLCFAGGIARQILAAREVLVGAHILRIGAVCDTPYDMANLTEEILQKGGESGFPTVDWKAAESMQNAIEEARMAQDSIGGVVECAALHFPAGVGGPLFGGLEGKLSSILFGIPAVKGVEFGEGFAAAAMRGSENNDPFILREGEIRTTQNHAGGILGGISSGMPIIARVAFKPTPSISQTQQTVDFIARTQGTVNIKGRHDPCVVVRAVPVVEAAMSIALLDSLLEAEGYRNYNSQN